MDENLSGLLLADSLNAYIEPHGCTFLKFPWQMHQGAPDEDLPRIATELGASALLSKNYKDVGAERFYFRALLDAGISVVSLRVRNNDSGNHKYIEDTLNKHVQKIAKTLVNTQETVVISVDRSSARPHSLQEIIDEPSS